MGNATGRTKNSHQIPIYNKDYVNSKHIKTEWWAAVQNSQQAMYSSLDPQTSLWSYEDQPTCCHFPKCPHFASRMQILVLST